MKTLYTLFALISFSSFTHTAQACDMPEGFHEFVTFGENSVYLSHYPMFGSIHSYQILVKADFSQDGQNINAQFLALRKSKPGVSFSTSPIRSDGEEAYAALPDYAKVGSKFQARIHYEGKNHQSIDVFKNVTVEVKEVIVNRLMNQPKVGAVKPSALSYFYFGDNTEGYLLHQMYWNPDFDQIVQVAPVPAISSSKCAGAITLSNRNNSEKERLLPNQSAQATSSCNESFVINPIKEVYEDKMTIQH